MAVTSITISILLLALQQSASAMTAQVFDQFLRRPVNQAYFGFFVGLALFALVTLGTVSETFNPVLGASITLLLTVVGLYLLILLMYTTINQMRPVVIIGAIRDHVMSARETERRLLVQTTREPRFEAEVEVPVHLSRQGFITHLDIGAVGRVVAAAQGDVEVVMLVSIGSFVAFGDAVAEVRARTGAVALEVAEAVARAVHLERAFEPVAGSADDLQPPRRDGALGDSGRATARLAAAAGRLPRRHLPAPAAGVRVVGRRGVGVDAAPGVHRGHPDLLADQDHALLAAGRADASSKVAAALEAHRRSIGRLGSGATRVG